MRKHLFLMIVIFFSTTAVGMSNFLKDPPISKVWQNWVKDGAVFLDDFCSCESFFLALPFQFYH